MASIRPIEQGDKLRHAHRIMNVAELAQQPLQVLASLRLWAASKFGTDIAPNVSVAALNHYVWPELVEGFEYTSLTIAHYRTGTR